MNRIKGVIFDWAGTTVDFGCTSPVSAFKEAFRRAGIEVTDEEVRAPMGLLKRDHIKTMLAMTRIAQAWQDKYGAAATDADAEKIYADFEPALMAVLDRHCDLIPGILETMEYLRQNEIRVGSTPTTGTDIRPQKAQSFLGSFFCMVTGANRAARLSRAQKSPVETFEAHAPTTA